jgi:hypothetical protein
VHRRLSGLQGQPGPCGVEKNHLPPPGIEPQPFSPSLYPLSSLLCNQLISSKVGLPTGIVVYTMVIMKSTSL